MRLNISFVIFVVLLTLSLVACAQRTTRPNLKLKQQPTASAEYDTIVPKPGDIVISGYDKVQNTSTESFFVTNNTDDTIDMVNVTLTYYTMGKEQLHHNTQTIPIYLGQGETRNVSVKSWDKQHLWYYHRTLAKNNGHCTPFDVRATVNYYLRK